MRNFARVLAALSRRQHAAAVLLAVVAAACPTQVSSPRQEPVIELPPRFFADPPFGVGFDCVVIGCDQERSLIIENRGGGILKLASIRPRVDTSTDFQVRRKDALPLPTEDDQLEMPAGMKLELVIRYRPSDGAPDDGAVVFTHYDGALAYEDSAPRTDEVPLTTRSLGTPGVGTVDAILDFGYVPVGDRRELRLVVDNDGTDAVLLAGPLDREEGTSPVFAPPSPRDWGERFANPGETIEIPVVFEPLTQSAYFGALLLTTNDPDRPRLRVAVQGTAIDDPRISVVAPISGSLVLPSVRINEVREGSIVVQNLGGRPLDVVGEIADGALAGFSIAPVEALTLPPLAAATLTVTLTSPNGGPAVGVARLRSNDPTQPEAFVELSGDVTSPVLAASPGALDFGNIVQGWTAPPQQLAITNNGYGDLTITSIALEVGSSQQIRLVDVPSLPQKLAPGEPALLVTVLVEAITIGPANGVIAIGSDSIDGTVARVDVRANIVTCEQGCPIPNGSPNCSQGFCDVGSCVEGFHNPDLNAANGCECTEDPGGDIPPACTGRSEIGGVDDCGGDPSERNVFGTLHAVDDVDVFHTDVRDTSDFGCDNFGDSSQTSAELLSAPIGLALCANIQGGGSGCGGNSTFFDQGRCKVFNGSPVEFHHCGGFGGDDNRSLTFWLLWAPNAEPQCGSYHVRVRGKENNLCD